jgi:hypothetical protein
VRGSATSIPEVIARMEAIGTSLPASDGVACFNRVYLEVTGQIRGKVGQQFFSDPAFITALDITFANLYFEAIDAADEATTVPLAWRPLIERRGLAGIEPIQFALAGMNAHINHDLPIAVVSTCTDLGTAPTADAHLADYQKVDGVLDAEEQAIRQSFESAPELAIDRHLQAVDNLVASWSINGARDLAWTNALLLWELRDVPIARRLFTDGLAATVALGSRTLLVAV